MLDVRENSPLVLCAGKYRDRNSYSFHYARTTAPGTVSIRENEKENFGRTRTLLMDWKYRISTFFPTRSRTELIPQIHKAHEQKYQPFLGSYS